MVQRLYELFELRPRLLLLCWLDVVWHLPSGPILGNLGRDELHELPRGSLRAGVALLRLLWWWGRPQARRPGHQCRIFLYALRCGLLLIELRRDIVQHLRRGLVLGERRLNLFQLRGWDDVDGGWGAIKLRELRSWPLLDKRRPSMCELRCWSNVHDAVL